MEFRGQRVVRGICFRTVIRPEEHEYLPLDEVELESGTRVSGWNFFNSLRNEGVEFEGLEMRVDLVSGGSYGSPEQVDWSATGTCRLYSGLCCREHGPESIPAVVPAAQLACFLREQVERDGQVASWSSTRCE